MAIAPKKSGRILTKLETVGILGEEGGGKLGFGLRRERASREEAFVLHVHFVLLD